MKAIFTICALFCLLFSFGQTNFRSGLIRNTNDEFSFYDLVQMGDGSYVCVGDNYLDDAGTEGILIVKYNAQGQLLSTKNLVPGSYDEDVEGISVIKTSDGGVAVSGNINDTISLLKFDASLNLQWHKQLVSSIEAYSYGTRLLQTSDGGYLVAGSIEKNDTGFPDAGTVIKTDASGTVVWSKQYFDFAAAGASGDKYIYDITTTKDGNYLLLADSYSYSSANGDQDSTYLIKINGSGNIMWSKYITATALADQSPVSVISTSDGNFLLCGYSFDENFLASPMLIKVSQEGNVVWSYTSVNSSGYDTYLYEITEDRNGNYIASGELDSTDADLNQISQPYFLKVSSSGNQIWTKVINDNSTDGQYVFGITATTDGGFAAAGYLDDLTIGQNGFDQSAGLYKFASDGSICGPVSSSGSLVNLQASTVTKSVPVTTLSTSAFSTTLTVGSAGSGTNICSVLPLQLLSFNATLQNKSVSIEWKTANEINTDHFTVERSGNGTLFNALQTVSAKGSNSTVQTYNTNDLKPLSGTSYYRLQQVDKDGKTTYSNTVPVIVSANGTVVITPNPVRNDIHVLMQSAASSNATFSVTDIAGKLLLTKTTAINTGTNTITIPAASLSKGLYVLTIKDGHSTQSLKFVKE